MAEFTFITAEDAYKRSKAGEALLVCAYGDDRCRKLMIEGAISLEDLEAGASIDIKKRQIIFYCA
jgi:hypothetical protein